MLNDVGVARDSVRYYHDADPFTAQYLYFVPHAGIYHCNSQYVVQRDHLDVCQLILVEDGALSISYLGQTQIAHAGQFILLDCRQPHRYCAHSDTLRFRWFHFIGCSSFAYTARILDTHGFLLPAAHHSELEGCFHAVMTAVHHQQPDAHMLSVAIHRLLALLMISFDAPEKHGLEKTIAQSAAYIEENYGSSELSIEQLSRRAALSACYYVRKFKEYQSMTPHQYLQAVRIRMAKQQLSTTSHSIEAIASNCGFSNASHFILVFKRAVGMTPLQFRTMWK